MKHTNITSEEMQSRTKVSRPTVFKRLRQAHEGSGIATFDGETFFVRKDNGKYQIYPMTYNPEAIGESDIIAGMIEQLTHMREVVCEDCRLQVVDRVIQQLEAKQ